MLRPMNHLKQLQRLDQQLREYEWLWRPQPFKEVRPVWCQRVPALAEALLALSDEQHTLLTQDNVALFTLLETHIPGISEFVALTTVTMGEALALAEQGPHFSRDIPGRKWQQIQMFASRVGEIQHPVLEWCGGKGHLGRLLAAQWQQPVTTAEWNADLCATGEKLASRTQVKQQFKIVDLLGPIPQDLVKQQHGIALHACGELHRVFIRQAIDKGLPAVDLVPCCYYQTPSEIYAPFTPGLKLQLDYNGLRLAITETITSNASEILKRDQDMAWKLGYQMILQQEMKLPYKPMKPVPKQWLKGSFQQLCEKLAERHQIQLPAHINWHDYQSQGEQRLKETMRLGLPRHALRRAIELWLVLDMACHLERHGYTTTIQTFCEREITPRNLLLSGRRAVAEGL